MRRVTRTRGRIGRLALAIAATAALLPAALPSAAAAHVPASARALAAKSCSAGYVKGVIGGEQKCLRRGEYCAHGYATQYHRYGYNCVAMSGAYHLEPRALSGHALLRP